MWLYLEIESLQRESTKVRSLGWASIKYDWRPYKNLGQRDSPRGTAVWAQGRRQPSTARERSPARSLPHKLQKRPTLTAPFLETSSFQSCEAVRLWLAPQSVGLCYSGPSWLIQCLLMRWGSQGEALWGEYLSWTLTKSKTQLCIGLDRACDTEETTKTKALRWVDGLLREEEEVCCGGAEGAAMGKWAGRGQTAGQGWPTVRSWQAWVLVQGQWEAIREL